MRHDDLSTTQPDMVGLVAKLFHFNAPSTPAPTTTLVALPTQQDIDAPVTPEARAALAIAAHAAAAVLERETGVPTTAAQGYVAAQRILSAYLLTYRRVAQDTGAGR